MTLRMLAVPVGRTADVAFMVGRTAEVAFDAEVEFDVAFVAASTIESGSSPSLVTLYGVPAQVAFR